MIPTAAAPTTCALGLLWAGLLLWLVGCSPPRAPDSLPALLALSSHDVAQVPIARVNLLCAQDLLPAPQPPLSQSLATLKSWADRVRAETDRHLYRFRQHPVEFDNSEAFFRMVMLAVVLAEDCSVHYSPTHKIDPGAARVDDNFFADPRAIFLQGLLASPHEGTCSSMPVLYVAVGRQLGYPLKLVTTKGHLFLRWESPSEHFNVEATGRGVNRFPDDYYRHWPFDLAPGDEAAEGYLHSLSPAEELATFLSIRGMCLRQNGRLFEAADAFRHAARLMPACRGHRYMLARTEALLATSAPQQSAAKISNQRKPDL